MPRKTNILLVICFTFISLYSSAQLLQDAPPPSKTPWQQRIFTGGNFGLQFGTQTIVQISPLLGYRITEKLSAGVTANYLYFKNNYYNYSTHIYGGGVFSRLFVYENLFLHSEYEVLSLEVPRFYSTGYERTNVTSVLIGGGYRERIGERSGIDLLLLYNINQSRNSPYQNPILRLGFIFGF